MIRIMVVDDNKDILQYFQMILDKEANMEVVGVATSGKEAVELAPLLKPDVILMDIQMETENAGIVATEKIKQLLPDVKVIIITIHSDDELLFQAYSAGVVDYIIKTDSITQIIASINGASQNQLMLRNDIATKIVSEFTRIQKQNTSLLYALNIITQLTNSEFEVLRCFYEGQSYKEIAEARFVSKATIKSQVSSILKKFDMSRMNDVIALLRDIQFEELCIGRR